MTEYKKIKVSSEHEPRMLDVLLATNQKFKAISLDEYYIANSLCDLLTEKKIPYQKIQQH